ncbi:MAG: adenosylcobinamide amidohydrolase [Acidobacteriota bacterium]
MNSAAPKIKVSAETLRANDRVQLTRSGRFLIAELLTPHRVLSTSTRNGGQRDDLRFLVNHQSLEGSGHIARERHIIGLGLAAYHDSACSEIALDPTQVALMGTAANMNYAAIEEARFDDVHVLTAVTAGVQGNAACAGDPALWHESERGWEKVPYAGTINTIAIVNVPLTEGALARAAMTITEAKSAALAQLGVRSLYSYDLATGTGTDQYCLAAPLTDAKPRTDTGPHSKLGEVLGSAVRAATVEALRWQNGMEPSYTRGIFHALGRYGIPETRFFEDMAAHLTGDQLELLKRNNKSLFYEPYVAAAAYALAAILDRVRHGTLPPKWPKKLCANRPPCSPRTSPHNPIAGPNSAPSSAPSK